MMLKQFNKNYSSYILFIILLLFLFPQINFAKISDRNAIKTFWKEAPIMPGAAKYFIRTEKIEKKTKSLNNHPIKISPDILRKMFKQLSYKYDRSLPEIPLFSNKELILLSEYIPNALMGARPSEDVTFVIKGPHSSERWSFKEERLTAGRIFVVNNQLNLILGAVQVSLQPTLSERYEGKVWESTSVVYDIGHRRKVLDYEGLIILYNKNKGIYRKSNERKDWFIFTNTAYKQAKETIDFDKTGKEQQRQQYQTLQQQIDSLQKQLNKPSRKEPRGTAPPTQQQQIQEKKPPVITKKQKNKDNVRVIEQRLKTIDNLYKKGILSEEEYQRKRNEILKGI